MAAQASRVSSEEVQLNMDEQFVVAALFAASGVVAAIAAWGKVNAPRILSVATAVALAAAAFFVQVSDVIK
jgi:hypothetical protein